MARISFDQVAAFKVGDIYYECEMATNLRARVTKAPELGSDGPDGRRTLRWEAENTETGGDPIDYFLTEGLEHYGPRLYTQPEYVRVRPGGKITIPLLGVDPADEPSSA